MIPNKPHGEPCSAWFAMWFYSRFLQVMLGAELVVDLAESRVAVWDLTKVAVGIEAVVSPLDAFSVLLMVFVVYVLANQQSRTRFPVRLCRYCIAYFPKVMVTVVPTSTVLSMATEAP